MGEGAMFTGEFVQRDSPATPEQEAAPSLEAAILAPIDRLSGDYAACAAEFQEVIGGLNAAKAPMDTNDPQGQDELSQHVGEVQAKATVPNLESALATLKNRAEYYGPSSKRRQFYADSYERASDSPAKAQIAEGVASEIEGARAGIEVMRKALEVVGIPGISQYRRGLESLAPEDRSQAAANTESLFQQSGR